MKTSKKYSRILLLIIVIVAFVFYVKFQIELVKIGAPHIINYPGVPSFISNEYGIALIKNIVALFCLLVSFLFFIKNITTKEK